MSNFAPVAYLTVEEFARRAGLSTSTVRRYIRRGQLPHSQPGGPGCRIIIPVDALSQLSSESVDRLESKVSSDGPRRHSRPRWKQ